MNIGSVTFAAEIANTGELRTKGLSERDALDSETGMLFIFDDGRASAFWMKGMRFPLDFVWIGSGCTVVAVVTWKTVWLPGARTAAQCIARDQDHHENTDQSASKSSH